MANPNSFKQYLKLDPSSTDDPDETSEDHDDDEDIGIKFLEVAISTGGSKSCSSSTMDLLSKMASWRIEDQRCELSPRRSTQNVAASAAAASSPVTAAADGG